MRLEDSILDGAVYVERSELTGYPSFMYRPKGWKSALPLKNASSMVSDLAPVVLYLRHLVEPGNVLIIEEPESSLHPGHAGRVHPSDCSNRSCGRSGDRHDAQ